MKRRIYIDTIGPYIKHEGYVWRPLSPLHIAHGPSCQCGSKAMPETSVECSATFGSFGPGLLTVRFPSNCSSCGRHATDHEMRHPFRGGYTEHWRVRYEEGKRHEIRPGVFEVN